MAILLAMARNTENLTLNTSSLCEQSELAKQDIFCTVCVCSWEGHTSRNVNVPHQIEGGIGKIEKFITQNFYRVSWMNFPIPPSFLVEYGHSIIINRIGRDILVTKLPTLGGRFQVAKDTLVIGNWPKNLCIFRWPETKDLTASYFPLVSMTPWGKTPSPQTDKSNLLHPLRCPFESLAIFHSNRCCHKSNQQPHQCKLSDPQPTCFQVNPNLTPWPADQTLTENTWTTPDKSKQCIAKDLKTWLVEIQGTLKMIWKGDVKN